jgi:hypothetical protein
MGRLGNSAALSFEEWGAMGWLVGMGREKPSNIAAVVILVSFAAIFGIAAIPESSGISKRDLVIVFSNAITAALGFVFGRRSE